MFPIFADTFLTASRMDKPGPNPDDRLRRPDHRNRQPGGLSRLWYFLS